MLVYKTSYIQIQIGKISLLQQIKMWVWGCLHFSNGFLLYKDECYYLKVRVLCCRRFFLIDCTLYSVTNIPNNPFKQKNIKELLNINFIE